MPPLFGAANQKATPTMVRLREKITYRYAHLFPSVQDDMAEALNEEWKEGFDVREEGRQEPMEE